MDLVQLGVEAAAAEASLGRPVTRVLERFIVGTQGEVDAFFAARQRRRDGELEAEERVTVALADEVVRGVPEQRDAVERAGRRWLGRILKQEARIADVGVRARRLLLDAPPVDDAPEPSERVIERVEAISADATEPELREILAQLLAGELRHGGSFSLQMLEMVRVLDAELTRSAQFVRNLIPRESWAIPASKWINMTPDIYAPISAMMDLGVLRRDATIVLEAEGLPTVLTFGTRALRINASEDLSTRVIAVTNPGVELLGLLPREDLDEDTFHALAESYRQCTSYRNAKFPVPVGSILMDRGAVRPSAAGDGRLTFTPSGS